MKTEKQVKPAACKPTKLQKLYQDIVADNAKVLAQSGPPKVPTWQLVHEARKRG